MSATQETVKEKTFYSRVQCLVLHPSAGQRVMAGGELVRINEKIVEFNAMGGDPRYGEFGSYTTDDPEIIAFLEKRALQPNADVMTVETYNDVIVPDKMKVDQLRDHSNLQDRMIEEQNRLIADLKRQVASKVITPVKQ